MSGMIVKAVVDDDFPINLGTKVLLEDVGHTVIDANSDANRA